MGGDGKRKEKGNFMAIDTMLLMALRNQERMIRTQKCQLIVSVKGN